MFALLSTAICFVFSHHFHQFASFGNVLSRVRVRRSEWPCILYKSVVLGLNLLLRLPLYYFLTSAPIASLQLLHQSAAAWSDAVLPPPWLPFRGRNTTSPPCRASPSTPSSSPGSLSSRACLQSLPYWQRRRSRWWWLNHWWVHRGWELVSRNMGNEIQSTTRDASHTAEITSSLLLPFL